MDFKSIEDCKKQHYATNSMTFYIYSKVDTHYITHVFIHMHCNCPVIELIVCMLCWTGLSDLEFQTLPRKLI